jgi:hypothetical protein
VGKAAQIHLEIETLHGRAREGSARAIDRRRQQPAAYRAAGRRSITICWGFGVRMRRHWIAS